MKWTSMVKHFTSLIYLDQSYLLFSENVTVTGDSLHDASDDAEQIH